MSDLKSMNMSELIALHNELANKTGKDSVTEFKSLAAARSAVSKLQQGSTMTENTNPTTPGEGVALAEDSAKYNSSGKRGPTQGVGAFAKELIAAGKTNAEVLEAVKKQFPTAKTTTGCIAYYRAAVKNPNLGKRAKAAKTPEELRAQAQALLDAATAAEVQAREKAEAEAAKAAAAAQEAQPA